MIRPNLPVDRPETTRFVVRRGHRVGVRNLPDGRAQLCTSGPVVGFESPEQMLEFATALLAAADEWASSPQSPTQNG